MKPDATTMPIDIGDWVHSDSPGIWRVYRVIRGVQRVRFGLQERQRVDRRRLVFSKRFLDASWTPAFRNELAVAEFVHALSDDSRSRLEQYIVQNPQAVREFEAFRPKAIDFAMDLPLNVPGSVSKEDVEGVMHNTFADIGEGLTNDAVLRRIAESDLAGLAPKTIRNATLRFVCQDHELRDGEYVFREVQLLMA